MRHTGNLMLTGFRLKLQARHLSYFIRVFWGLPSFLAILALTDADATIFRTGNKGQFPANNNINDANAADIPLSLGNQIIPAIFNFGDSNSDTGSSSAAFALVPYPNGITSFGNSSGRLCDGRLIIDFLAEKLSLPYLSSYLNAMEGDFRHGANFASAGTTIMPVNGTLYGTGITPLAINIQLLQFRQLKERVTELYSQDETSIFLNRLPKPEDFSNALYTFDIAQNDLTALYLTAEDQAYKSLPELIDRFSLHIEHIHKLGARNFWIHNTGPLGCLPLFLEIYPSGDKDEIGCLRSVNEMAQAFNRLLKDQVYLLRTKLPDSSLIYVDIYSTKYSLIRDAKLNGFGDPFGYCCEECMKNSNPFWNRTIADEIPPYVSCDNPSKYISWDSAHYTEAANRWIANKIYGGSLDDSNPTM